MTDREPQHGQNLKLVRPSHVWNFGAIGPGPPGYAVIQLDSGHSMYLVLTEDGTDHTRESAIHWNRYVVRRWAWEDYRERQGKA